MLVDGMIIRREPLQPQETWPADANRPLRQQAVLHRFAGVATTVPPQRCQTREGRAKLASFYSTVDDRLVRPGAYAPVVDER